MSKSILSFLLFVTLFAVGAKSQVLPGIVDIPLEILNFQHAEEDTIVSANLIGVDPQEKLLSKVLQITIEGPDCEHFQTETETLDLINFKESSEPVGIKIKYTPNQRGTHYARLAVRGVNLNDENVILAYVNVRGVSK